MQDFIEHLNQFVKEERIKKIKEQLPKNKDFSNMDLSHFDLSIIEPEFWNGAIFYNTNFSNTGIRFYPQQLYNLQMIDCNFEGTDLSYLSTNDFRFLTIKGCNFRNTNLKVDLTVIYQGELYGVVLDSSYSAKTKEYWYNLELDMKTLEMNPFIRVFPIQLLQIIRKTIPNRYTFLSHNDIKMYIQKSEILLENFDDGSIFKLYNMIKKYGTLLDCLRFFQGYIENIDFFDITFKEIPRNVLDNFEFKGCTFRNVIFENSISELTSMRNAKIFDNENNLTNVIFNDLSFDSWKDLKSSRIGNGIITFKRNLYLELGTRCNCNCSFCRNSSFITESSSTCRNRYNLDRIKKNLLAIRLYLDNVFIGGGEPTLRINDIKELYLYLREYNVRPNLVVVTNGSINNTNLSNLLEYVDSVYISRHSISDDENIAILNPSKNTKILSLEDISNLSEIREITLSPVCVKNGLDSSEKIMEYISTAFKFGVKSVLISTLHRDASYGSFGINYGDLYVSPNIFCEVKQELLLQGYSKKPQICSTGGYLLDIFTSSNYSVAFKEYIDKKDEEKLWFEKCKRTFDFSMSPNGDIFENWRQDKLINLETLSK